MAYLLGFFFACGIPGEFFFESKAIEDNGFLLTKFLNPASAVTMAEAAVFASAHRRFENYEVDQAIIDAYCAAIEFLGEVCRRRLSRAKCCAKAVARIVGQSHGLLRIVNFHNRNHRPKVSSDMTVIA